MFYSVKGILKEKNAKKLISREARKPEAIIASSFALQSILTIHYAIIYT